MSVALVIICSVNCIGFLASRAHTHTHMHAHCGQQNCRKRGKHSCLFGYDAGWQLVQTFADIRHSSAMSVFLLNEVTALTPLHRLWRLCWWRRTGNGSQCCLKCNFQVCHVAGCCRLVFSTLSCGPFFFPPAFLFFRFSYLLCRYCIGFSVLKALIWF